MNDEPTFPEGEWNDSTYLQWETAAQASLARSRTRRAAKRSYIPAFVLRLGANTRFIALLTLIAVVGAIYDIVIVIH